MKVHPNLYASLDTQQVMAIDKEFAHRKGTLSRFYKAGDNSTIYTSYDALAHGEGRLTREEIIKLNKILYAPKVDLSGIKISDSGQVRPADFEPNPITVDDLAVDIQYPGLFSAGHPEEIIESKPGSFSKLKNSAHKDMIHLIPLNVIREVAAVYTDSFALYGEDWKELPNAKNEFYNSMMRHLERWQSGEYIDPDGGHLHIIKALGNLIFLAWHELKEGK